MAKGNAQLMVIACSVLAVCFTIVYTLLFLSLWEYREVVGGSFLGLLLLLAVVYAKGKLTEQSLRQQRFRHQEETPLDETGEPYFWQPGVQQNPHRFSTPQQEYYQEYRQR